MVGRNRDDLVIRMRSRATWAGFALSILRIPGAFRGLPAATEVAIHVQRAGPHFCIDLDAASHCGLGFSIGDGWTHLDPGLPLAARFRSAMDFAFLAALLLPCGYWFRRAWASQFAIALVVGGVVFLPRALVLLPTPPAQLLACAVGLASGAALGARASRDRCRRAVPGRAGDSRSGTE